MTGAMGGDWIVGGVQQDHDPEVEPTRVGMRVPQRAVRLERQGVMGDQPASLGEMCFFKMLGNPLRSNHIFGIT